MAGTGIVEGNRGKRREGSTDVYYPIFAISASYLCH